MRDQPTERYTQAPRSRTRCAPTRGLRALGSRRAFLVGAHPVRDKPTERCTEAWPSRTGCAPTDKQERRKWGFALTHFVVAL